MVYCDGPFSLVPPSLFESGSSRYPFSCYATQSFLVHPSTVLDARYPPEIQLIFLHISSLFDMKSTLNNCRANLGQLSNVSRATS